MSIGEGLLEIVHKVGTSSPLCLVLVTQPQQ